MNRRTLLSRLPLLAALPFAMGKAAPLGAEPLGDVSIKLALGEGDGKPRVSVDGVEYTARSLTVEMSHPGLAPLPPDDGPTLEAWREGDYNPDDPAHRQLLREKADMFGVYAMRRDKP